MNTLRTLTLAAATAALLTTSSAALAAATITILNTDGAGIGFNDPTPVAPVGGNVGTTLGQQRLNAFGYAASIWGAKLTSSVTITINASWPALSCTATGAVLGSAGAVTIHANFAGAPLSGTWYPQALANKIRGIDSDDTQPDIVARFNRNLGQPGCLTGVPFYYGIDNNAAGAVDLVAVLLHEFGHGLGFQTFTSGATGAFIAGLGLPSVWDHFLFDNTQGLSWAAMPADANRVASAVNTRKLVWTGSNVTANAAAVLTPGVPQLGVSGTPSTANGIYDVGTVSFGPPLSAGSVVGDIMPIASDACTPLSGADALAANGNLALINRGVCAIAVKVKNAQNAGARGVVIANNAAGSPAPNFSGSDPTITIPTAVVTLADATALRSVLQFRSRTRSGIVGTLFSDGVRLQGADAAGRLMMYTPNPFQQGSSVSHFDQSATRNLLMEPSISADLSHSVDVPQDLTFKLLQDIGW